MNGITALVQTPQRAPSSLPPWEDSVRNNCDPGGGLPPDTESSSSLILDFPTSTIIRNNVPSYISHLVYGTFDNHSRNKDTPSTNTDGETTPSPAQSGGRAPGTVCLVSQSSQRSKPHLSPTGAWQCPLPASFLSPLPYPLPHLCFCPNKLFALKSLPRRLLVGTPCQRGATQEVQIEVQKSEN